MKHYLELKNFRFKYKNEKKRRWFKLWKLCQERPKYTETKKILRCLKENIFKLNEKYIKYRKNHNNENSTMEQKH